MKSIRYTIFLIFLVFLHACGTSRPSAEDSFPVPEHKRLSCNGKRFYSDSQYIRAMGKGRSQNESAASRMAHHDANVQLAKAVDAYFENVSRYNERKKSQEYSVTVEWDQQILTRESLNVILQNVSVVCSQTRFRKGFYQKIQIVEIPIEELKLKSKI
jgi:hypothetical protein